MADRLFPTPKVGAKSRSPNKEITYRFISTFHWKINDGILAITVYLRMGTLLNKILTRISKERRRIASTL